MNNLLAEEDEDDDVGFEVLGAIHQCLRIILT
jgi:hypothetical protein